MHTMKSSRVRISPLALLAIVALTGCRPVGLTGRPVNQHAIIVHPDGRPLASYPPDLVALLQRPAGRRLNEREAAIQMHELMEAVRASPHDTIIVFVHGGRVSQARGYRGTEARMQRMLDAGYHPIFLNWNSSEYSAMFDHIFRTRQGQDWGPRRGPLSAPLVIAADAGRTVSRAPMNTLHLLGDYCRVLGGMRRGALQGVERGSRVCRIPGVDTFRRQQARYEAHLDDGTGLEGAPADELTIGLGTYDLGYARGTARFASAVLTFVPQLLTGPLVDGFGSGAYQEMGARAEATIRSRREYVPDETTESGYFPPTGVMHALIDSLQELLHASGHDSVPPERRRQRAVILAGHSMGTRVLDGVLVRFPDLPVARIYYMASASSVADLERSVVPFLARNRRTRYFHGMLHPYAEAGEWQPGLLDMVPRGSLLEWIDDYLASPETPFDRVSGKWSNIIAARQIFTPAVRGRVVLKAFGVGDSFDREDPVLRSAFVRHAGFSHPDFAFWDDRSWAVRPWITEGGRVVAPLLGRGPAQEDATIPR